jgi:hypothetical protein
MNFYIGDYTKAITDFEDSIKSKQDQKDESEGGTGDNMSHSSN